MDYRKWKGRRKIKSGEVAVVEERNRKEIRIDEVVKGISKEKEHQQGVLGGIHNLDMVGRRYTRRQKPKEKRH